jgi:outer membrane protein
MGAEQLTLNQATQLALAHNANVVNAGLDVSKTKDRYGAFRSSFFPKLSFYALGSEQLRTINITIPAGSLGYYNSIGYLPAHDVKYSTPMEPTGFILGRVAQPLSGLYRTHLNADALRTSTEIALEKQRGSRQDVVRNVKQLYYQIAQAESSLAATRESIQLYKEVERTTINYVAAKASLPSDLLQVQANLADAENSELTVANQEAKAKEQLNDLMGRDVTTDFEVSAIEDAEPASIDLAAARKKALAQRPELRQAELKVQQTGQELRAKRAEYIPEISAEFNTLSLLNFNSFLPGGSYSVGVSLSWEPFDWGRKKNEIAEKRDTLAQDKNNQSSTERKVLMDVDDKYRAIQLSRSKLRAAKLTQAAASETLRVNKDQYQVRSVLLQVVFQSQTALAQANADFTRALADFYTAQADWEQALGNDQ